MLETTEEMLTQEDYEILAGIDPNGLSRPAPIEAYRQADRRDARIVRWLPTTKGRQYRMERMATIGMTFEEWFQVIQ